MTTIPNKYAIVSLPYERSAQFKNGMRHAPNVILNELAYLDTFEIALQIDPMNTYPREIVFPHDDTLLNLYTQQTVAATAVNELLQDNNFVISLGGASIASWGPIHAAQILGPLGVVCLGGHGDFGPENSLRNATETGIPVLAAGVRALSAEEDTYIKDNSLPVVHASEVIRSNDWYDLLDLLPERIYLTVRADYFDPSDVPAVQRPLQGGPSYENTIVFLRHLFASKKVVAADIMELVPGGNDAASVRLIARLLNQIVGLALDND